MPPATLQFLIAMIASAINERIQWKLDYTCHLSRNFAAFVDVNEIATLPKFMALTEVNLGFAVAYGLEKASPSAADDGVITEKPGEAGDGTSEAPAE